MAREYVVVCALPYSLDREDFNVSLFLSPTIETPDETRLDQWGLFRDWGAAAASLTVELSDDQGIVECEPLLEVIDPDLWKAIFPADLAVRPSEVPDWSKRKWRSFSARQVHDIALGMHMATILADPANPPAPAHHPLSEAIGNLANDFHCFQWDRADRSRRVRYDESQATLAMDELVELPRSLEAVDRAIASTGGDWMKRVALELHRCRRFYERPEAQWPYERTPTPGEEPPPLPKNEPEFHARCALLGDQPALERRLGLVIDLRVPDSQRLRASKWLSASLLLNGNAISRTTRVRCHATGEAFTTVPRTSDWSDGALALGDPERFSVLTLDTDGSALKADRFLWTLPRLLAIESNGDPVDAASPAQRSPGFTVSATAQAMRTTGDLARQAKLARDLTNGRVPTLDTEDVTRGVRVEVWDDSQRKWQSLHSRLSTAVVHDFGKAYNDLEEEGFIQGTAAHENVRTKDSPVQVHEALFGWEGWSLSAPRPGKRIWEENGESKLLDEEQTAPDTIHPYQITTKVKFGSLPRLRYGRSYAFRAWAVDLAGNSRPHTLNPPSPSIDLDGLNGTAASRTPWKDPIGPNLMTAVRNTISRRVTVEPRFSEPAEGELDPEVLAHVRARRSGFASSAELAGMNRIDRLSTAVSQAIQVGERSILPVEREAPHDRRELVSSHAAMFSVGAVAGSIAVKKALDTVTTPRRFLRWEPVSSPAIVPRWRYTEGESLPILVIRSGVTQDPDTLAITIEEPEDYAATAKSAVPDCGYRSTSQRHLAPPKVTEVQAELHGMFDQGVGSSSAAKRRKMLGWALRADGTFASPRRADIDNPPDEIPQPGMSIAHVGAPTTSLKTLPLPPGDPPAPGQTILHDVDELALPYLPDPLARGVAIQFPEAGKQWGLSFPFAAEGFTIAYRGDWPELEPYRLVLEGSSSLAASVSGRVIRALLPPGDVQQLRVSSSLPKGKLNLLGAWESLPQAIRNNSDVAEAAADGLLWGLSPFERVTLVHAVNRPIEAPRTVRILPLRTIGSTSATLAGAIDLHGPSTGTLSVEAKWEEPLDDLTLPIWITQKSGAKAFETIIQPEEDIALLGASDQQLTLPDIGPVNIHRAVHEFSDTRHRQVEYTFRAFTRFREYFHPDLLKDDQGNPSDEMHSVVGPVLRLSIPSSAPPTPPIVHSVLPMFRWSDETEAEQPMARLRTRRAGLRIYLDRPWYSSGEGELLAVLLARAGDDTHYPDLEDDSGFPFVSKWGADPIWQAHEVAPRALPALRLENLLHLTALDDRSEPARPSALPVDLPLGAIPGAPIATVLGYAPQYNAERQLWFVDIAIDPGPQFWPFLRLAVSRYQPESIPGCHLSSPVQCDFVQLPPERTAAINRTDDRHVRVVVSGPVGARGQAGEGDQREPANRIEHNRRVIARLQRRDPDIPTDLGWKTVAAERLGLRGLSADGFNATWVAELDAGETIPLVKPGLVESAWRIAVEEWELLEADDRIVSLAIADVGIPHMEPRLVYADNLYL